MAYNKTTGNQQPMHQLSESTRHFKHNDFIDDHARQRQFVSLSADPRGHRRAQHFLSVNDARQRQSRKNTPLSKVFIADPTISYKNNQVIRYGTTKSIPDNTHIHHNHDHRTFTSDTSHMLTNGQGTASKRLYASNSRKSAPIKTPPVSASVGSNFKRTVLERKEDSITFFDIEMEKSPFYQYRPGEEILGSVHMDIQRNVEIRYVELLIEGRGTVSVVKTRQSLPSTVREMYLRKHTFLIGIGDAAWSAVLSPGHYMSKFRFCLPQNLPSSISHDDLSSGFTMDINYFIKARICDDVGSSSIRSTSSINHLVKVLLTKKQPFYVQRPFDLNVIPSVTEPVTHTEDIYVSCAGNNRVVVTLYLERAIFLAGDDIKLQLAASIPHSQHIKFISCRLQQHLKLDKQRDMTTFTLSTVERTDPQSMSQVQGEVSYDVTLPTQMNLVTSFMQDCSMVRLTYTLAIEIRFSPAGGTLSFIIPLGIGPCAEPIYAEKISSRKAVPIFNRPTRFPCFSPSAQKGPLQVDRSSKSSQSINVVTKYSNNIWAKCFLCCVSSSDID